MSIAEMQSCLARLYIDEPFRKFFFLEAAALDEYRLTADEAEAIRGIDHMTLEQYAASLRNKRRGRIERAYPLLFALDKAEITRFYARYYQLYPAKADQSPQRDVLDFGAFVEDSVAGADTMPPYTADIARYERLYYLIRFAPRFRAAALPPSAPVIANSVTGDGDIPRLRDGAEIAEFDYDVADIEARLHASGQAPGAHDVAQSPSAIAFRPSTRTSAAKMARLNAATKAVLDRCDGSRSVAAIVSELETLFGSRALHRDIVAVMDRLLALEVLTLDPRLAATDADSGRAYGASESESM